MTKIRKAVAVIGLVLFLTVGIGYAQAGVNLAWDYTQEPTHPATGFVLERCVGANCTNFTVLAQLPLSPLTYTDNATQPNTVYRWRIFAKDAQGVLSVPSNVLDYTTPMLPVKAPANLRVVP